MSKIAHEHGATVDKFIGDAILAFFGDPETKGTREDAQACVAMAIAMQRRMVELNMEWRRRGIEQPFQARMGINTGFCNVGNFGSADRMDYTIIGAEANLAARLEQIAEPGGIVMSYETYAHVEDEVRARPLAPISLKGISREVIPYVVEGIHDERRGAARRHQRIRRRRAHLPRPRPGDGSGAGASADHPHRRARCAAPPAGSRVRALRGSEIRSVRQVLVLDAADQRSIADDDGSPDGPLYPPTGETSAGPADCVATWFRPERFAR